jgi:phosphatidate phosphatase PAH1
MSRSFLGCFVLVTACTTSSAPVGTDPDEAGTGDGKADGTAHLADVRCNDMPDAGAKTDWRHFKSNLITAASDGHHSGFDLVAAAGDDEQVIRGDISYTIFDKALEDEDVDVFACRRRAWVHLGTVRTDDDGQFTLTLTGDERLPVGMRDMAVSVAGDRTSGRFLAIVAPEDTELAVSDVDGTLTTSEEAFAANAFGIDADIHDGAVDGWKHLAASGRIPVYVTARARMFTNDTRDWLAKKGMPRGALRLAPKVLLPGSATVDYKTSTLEELSAELPIGLGVGNRGSDIEAYTNAGVAADRIFIKLPEFADEVASKLDAGDAVGFPTYPGPLGTL